ncbi:hypothetical protein [Nocardia lijiangensis]|uniref:hypothetical protein n=1 Tax=Nocardia lijiangensis TaxID=299618 RepID=UPI003D74A53C
MRRFTRLVGYLLNVALTPPLGGGRFSTLNATTARVHDPRYIDQAWGQDLAQARAEAQATVQRLREAAASEPPRVIMRRCTVCGTDIGPMDQTRG